MEAAAAWGPQLLPQRSPGDVGKYLLGDCRAQPSGALGLGSGQRLHNPPDGARLKPTAL